MTRITLTNEPRLKLSDLLRRRKSTLKQFIDEHGISTFDGLKITCQRMGVAPPQDDDFYAVVPRLPKVSSPQEGVVVVEPLPVIDETTGKKIDIEAPVKPEVIVVTSHPSSSSQGEQLPTDASQKAQQKKPKVTKKEDEPGSPE